MLRDAESAAITTVIRHELLLGAISETDFNQLNRMLSALPTYGISPQDERDFERFGFRLGQLGLLGRFTDAFLNL